MTGGCWHNSGLSCVTVKKVFWCDQVTDQAWVARGSSQTSGWMDSNAMRRTQTNKVGGTVNLFSLGYEGGRPIGPVGSVGSRDWHQSSNVPICNSSGGSQGEFVRLLFSDSKGHLYSLACSPILHLQTTSTSFSIPIHLYLSNLWLTPLPPSYKDT